MWTPPDLAVTSELLRRMLVGKPQLDGCGARAIGALSTPQKRPHEVILAGRVTRMIVYPGRVLVPTEESAWIFDGGVDLWKMPTLGRISGFR